ncbi:hypothetical protein [Microbacterium hydrocarbonoxydans]|uniref:Uncharacterized protein n=1 Tax=Microbacterium hydrocarbonoxydans TaxID=273678 RepID=A0A1H4KXI2_9MICO|nr:hypothetical protein [Microbacterium hydrocarbonoxydans]SEB62926.1 hypothetical protein SAMN04489807_1576 [Microbacterium hydrocarbonoxydans]
MSTESPFPSTDGPDAEDAAAASDPTVDEDFSDEDGVLYDDEVTPEFGILGFTLRELLIVGVWAIAFIASFFPYAGGTPVWGTGLHWILPIGVPTVAVFLLVLRRFSPDGIRRVGSLGIDQFASVAFSVAAVFWLAALWDAVAFAIGFGTFGLYWNGVVQLIAMLALVVLTVFAPLVPGLKEDFHGRLVTLAHRNANPVRPVIARPRPEPTAAAEPAPAASAAEQDPAVEQPDAPYEAPAAAPGEGDTTAYGAAYGAPAGVYTAPAAGLDIELSGEHATDEVARLDLAEQVPLSSHASGGGTGTDEVTSDEEYTPTYSRRSWGQEPEIVSDTGSIESLMGARAQDVASPETTAFPAIDDDLDATNPREQAPTPQPFWILAPTERDVHDERGEAIFRIGPNAWALVIEDRGGAYVVRHDDGRIGYLHDIADITKG